MSNQIPSTPFEKSYWVVPGKFLAGEYPAVHFFEEQTRTRIGHMLDAGIRVFIDLTQIGQLEPYESILHEQANWQDVEVKYHHFPIHDFDIPSKPEMIAILDTIDTALKDGKGVYVHCWGGIGRTGTVVGCYLVRQGMDGNSALEEIAHLRRDMPNAWMRSPESDPQEDMILNWDIGK